MKKDRDYTYCMRCVGRGHYGFLSDTAELNVCLFCNAIGLVHSDDGSPIIGIGPDSSILTAKEIELFNKLVVNINKRLWILK